MSGEVKFAISIGLATGYLMFVVTGVPGVGVSTTIALGLGSFFWLRGRKHS